MSCRSSLSFTKPSWCSRATSANLGQRTGPCRRPGREGDSSVRVRGDVLERPGLDARAPVRPRLIQLVDARAATVAEAIEGCADQFQEQAFLVPIRELSGANPY